MTGLPGDVSADPGQAGTDPGRVGGAPGGLGTSLDGEPTVPAAPELVAVIPVFNGWAETRQCLARLSPSLGPSLTVILVDHGSTDGTAAAVRGAFPAVHVVTAPSSLWWSGASNVGVRLALSWGAQWIMLLNNDCYAAPGAITALMAGARAHPGAIVGPVLRDLHSGACINLYFGTALWLGFPSLRVPRWWVAREQAPGILALPLLMGGRGVVVPREVWERIGLLDEDALPHYWADHDFYLRARKAGVPLLVVLAAAMDVDSGRTTAARGIGALDWAAFRATLVSRRSHRSVDQLNGLFRKHYPLPGFYRLGVALNLARYLMIYLISRAMHRFRSPR